MTWGSVVANVLVGGWFAMRALELYNAYQEDEEDAQRERHPGAPQPGGGSQQGGTRRVYRNGPLTFQYTFGGGGAASAFSPAPLAHTVCLIIMRGLIMMRQRSY